MLWLFLTVKKTKLIDGTEIFCLKAPEAKTLDHHVEGYLQHGIAIKDGDIVFDVGANIGVFGIRTVQRQPTTRIYCFEPIPDIYDVLKANAQKFDSDRMHVLAYGVSDTEEKVTFTYFPNTPALSTFHMEDWDDPKAFKTAVRGTMKNPPEGMKWMRLIPGIFAGSIAKHLLKGKKEVNCLIRNTSEVIKELNIERIDLLKIDCEGAELGVIKGIRNEDWGKIKSVVIEVNDRDGRLQTIRTILEENGFTKIHIEKESGLEETSLFNIYAIKE